MLEIKENEEDNKIDEFNILNYITKIIDILIILIIFTFILFYMGFHIEHNFFPFEVEKPHNLLYQFSQIIFVLSFFTKNILLLRFLYIFGSLLFISWTFIFFDKISIDFIIYISISVLVNLKQIIIILYSKRKIIFNNNIENIYQNIFKDFINKSNFKELIKSSFIRELPKDSLYCRYKDKCSCLSILLKGRLGVYKNNENMKYFIEENNFIDSSEWLLRLSKKDKGKRFNYNIKAQEDSLYLTWPKEILNDILNKDEELKQKINGILGIDVSNKLFEHSELY